MKKGNLLLIILLIIIINILFAGLIFAQTKTPPPGGTKTTPNKPVNLINPLTGKPEAEPIPTLIGKVIKGALGVVGSLALVMFIYGGLVWMTAAGNEQRVKTGKDILIWATIGLIVIFTSYALVHFIIFKGLGVGGE